MIKEYSIENFKSFKSKQSMRMAPITLIYGPNSSGKSSIIQSLISIKNTTESDSSIGALKTSGPLIELGGFESVVHGHDIENEISFEMKYFQVTSIDSTNEDSYILGRKQERHLKLSFAYGSTANKKSSSYLSKYFFEVSSSGVSQFKLDLVNFFEKEKIRLLSSLDNLSKFKFSDSKALNEYLDYVKRRIKRQYPKVLADQLCKIEHRALQDGHIIIDRNKCFPSNINTDETFITNVLANSLVEDIKEKMRSIYYLGPLRCYPSKISISSSEESSYVGKDGQDTIRMLYNNNSNILEAINSYFKKFQIPYEISIHNLGNSMSGNVLYMLLEDLRTHVPVTASDVGFGIGQLLPIIVQGLTEKNRVICVEQPEIHLHPVLQGHLGDYFIDSSMNHENQWIIETHSESLMLRLQRRIREGLIKNTDVSVLYVNAKNNGAEVKELRLDKDGDFIDSWPNGFFEERFNDVFGY
ncbi:DUF3696 domain-containing protein [Aeromonas hydrophila]|uniref:DUF3696 domain-containing protein n=1 Tax=Aeromonas bestiarum TaxID=105751 RepID=A0AAW7HWS0_9GAMM|nr:DUF3696 domain-containing protein [Aeromonas bestiarum]MDM5139582.1 DUF3696 domain-containing protein [Aeromonas bestiarum]